MATCSSSQQGPKGKGASPSGCEGRGLLEGWCQDKGSNHSAEACHSEAGSVAFGTAGEKGGNVRNILTQQSPPPAPLPQLRDGRWGGLIAEDMQMAEAGCPSLPPSIPILRLLGCVWGGGWGQKSGTLVSPQRYWGGKEGN